MLSEDELRDACFNVFVFIDAAGGTGGGIFRYMYGRFLKEAAAITGDARLVDDGAEIHSIGDHWQQAAGLFTEASNTPDPTLKLNEASARLLAIADCEQGLWERLQRLAN